MSNKNLTLESELLEPAIIVHSLNNLSFFLKIKPYLHTKKNKSYFSNVKLQTIFNYICVWYDKFNKFPKEKELLLLNEKLEKDEELKLLTDQIIKDIFQEDPESIDINFVEQETIKFIKENQVYEAIMLSQQDIENGNFDVLPERMLNAVTVNFDKDLGISVKNVQESIENINELDDNQNVITTGYPTLDNSLDGGFRGKELYVFAAPPGIGKTALLGNFAINAFLEDKKVLVFTFETDSKRLLTRYYSNIAEMTKKDIILNNDEAEDKINNAISNTNGDIIIKEYNANSVSSNDLLSFINDLKMYKSWIPEMIVIDYLLIMKTNDKFLKSENSYKYYKTISEEVRNIAKTLDVPVLSAAQINRSGQGEKGGTKPIITAKDISESRGIYDTCDLFCTINQTAKDKENNRMMIYIDKNRNGPTGLRIKLEVDYEHMRIDEV